MEVTWSTFLLEIINFLVLVWILKRFLYQPVLEVIARRRQGIEEQLANARALQQDAEDLKADYENRLAKWEQERSQLRDTLAEELEAERSRQLAALDASLAEARQKADVLAARERRKGIREAQQQALMQAARFASQLLAQAAGPELEDRLFEILLAGLKNLAPEQRRAFKNQGRGLPTTAQVSCAYPLSEPRRQQLQQVIDDLIGQPVALTLEQNPTLMAGFRLTLGDWVLDANLLNELKGFTEFAHAN